MDLNQLWQESKFDGVLPEDGIYYGTVESVKNKSTDKGFELLEITTVVDEGKFKGCEAKQTIFFYVPEKEDRSRMGMKNIRTLAERLDPKLTKIEDFYTVLNAMETVLPGYRVSFEQKTSNDGKYKNIWHHEILGKEQAPF